MMMFELMTTVKQTIDVMIVPLANVNNEVQFQMN